MGEFVSIILPVRNEEKYIDGCLRSIIAQDYPHDLIEILVIDGQSTDGTAQKIKEFRIQNTEFRIHLVDNPKLTVPYAMNIGIKAAKGDIIIRFDGHAIMEPDYVSNCVKYLAQTKADNVGGPIINKSNGSTIGRAIVHSHYSPFGLGGGSFRTGNYEGYTDTVTFGCFFKETFAKYGLYDTRLTRNQDIELNARIRKGIKLDSEFRIQNSEFGPGKIYLTPKIKSYYYCRNTLKGLWFQNFRNGQWVVYTKYIAPYSLSLRHFVPLVFVSSLLLAAVALFYQPQVTAGGQLLSGVKKTLGMRNTVWSDLLNLKYWPLRLLALRLMMLELMAYLGAMLVAVIQAGKRQLKVKPFDLAQGKSLKYKETGKNAEDRIQNTDKDENSIFNIHNSEFKAGALALLPLVFMTLHFSYGLGSIWGLISLAGWAKKRGNVSQ